MVLVTLIYWPYRKEFLQNLQFLLLDGIAICFPILTPIS